MVPTGAGVLLKGCGWRLGSADWNSSGAYPAVNLISFQLSDGMGMPPPGSGGSVSCSAVRPLWAECASGGQSGDQNSPSDSSIPERLLRTHSAPTRKGSTSLGDVSRAQEGSEHLWEPWLDSWGGTVSLIDATGSDSPAALRYLSTCSTAG